jgi:hypothetical protein
MTVLEVMQLVGPSVAVYVAIRVDLAVLKTRLDYIEKQKEGAAACGH